MNHDEERTLVRGAGRVSAFVLVPVHDDSGLRAAGPDTDARARARHATSPATRQPVFMALYSWYASSMETDG